MQRTMRRRHGLAAAGSRAGECRGLSMQEGFIALAVGAAWGGADAEGLRNSTHQYIVIVVANPPDPHTAIPTHGKKMAARIRLSEDIATHSLGLRMQSSLHTWPACGRHTRVGREHTVAHVP